MPLSASSTSSNLNGLITAVTRSTITLFQVRTSGAGRVLGELGTGSRRWVGGEPHENV